uniref:Uncharacterized protein n=1 Tax=Schistosoma mansoni TaxID=6183 RepID=A0A5K4EFU7_SCHMA
MLISLLVIVKSECSKYNEFLNLLYCLQPFILIHITEVFNCSSIIYKILYFFKDFTRSTPLNHKLFKIYFKKRSVFFLIDENNVFVFANFPIKLTESNKTTVISFNPSNMNNQNNFDDNQNNFHMKRDEYNIIKTNEINEELNQNPMVIAFSEEIDPADNEIYYLNNNTTNTTTNNHSGSPTESYATVTPNSDNDNVLNITDDNLHFKNNENLSHEIMDELQLNLRLEQCYSHGKKVNLDYSNQFKRSALKTIDGTMANSGQLIKSESRQNKNTDEQEGILGTNLKNNKNLSISNENIIILPTDDDALEKFLEDS